MKQFVVFVLTVLTSWSSVWANLGDSGDTIEDSYGAIIERHLRDDGTVRVRYHKDRYLYAVIFTEGRSVSETYSHVKGTDLSEKEIAGFLKANAGGATWTPDNKTKERRFERSDHKAEATYGNMAGRPTLTVRELHGSAPETKNQKLGSRRLARYSESIVPRQFELPHWHANSFFDSSVTDSSISIA